MAVVVTGFVAARLPEQGDEPAPAPVAEAGEEVVQLYVAAKNSKVERAPKELKAFARVALAPRETRTVHLSVRATDLAYYDEATSKWRIEPIGYTAIVGRHALDPNALRTDFRVV